MGNSGSTARDIFISYTKQDVARVRFLVEALELQGWTVWWDPEIEVGENWSPVLRRALAEARAVAVVWSEHSVESDWVHREARDGQGRGILVAVMLDPVSPTVEFNDTQAANLVGWRGRVASPGFKALSKRLAEVLDQPAISRPEPLRRRVRRTVFYRTHMVAAGLAIGTLIGAGAWLAPPAHSLESVDLRKAAGSAVRFRVARPDGETVGRGSSLIGVTERIRGSEIRIHGADEVRFPGIVIDGDTVLPEVVTAPTVNVLQGGGGPLALDPIRAPVGTRIDLAMEGGFIKVRIDSLPGSSTLPVLTVNTSGVVLFGTQQSGWERDLRGHEIEIVPGSALLTLEVRPVADSTYVAPDVAVTDLELSRPEGTHELEGSPVVRVATITEGDLIGRGLLDSLQATVPVRFETFQGTASVAATGDHLSLEAHADTMTGLVIGGVASMPPRFLSLSPGAKIAWLFGWATFALLVLLLLPRYWGAPR